MTLIQKIKLTPSESKKKFLVRLERFAYLGTLQRDITHLAFTDEELELLKPQIEARYKLKKKFRDQLHRQA